MAARKASSAFFTGPALLADIDPTHAGALVALSAASGRTMSPVAAVALISAEMTQTHHST